ncbi:MAG: CCA tRNA nucleotidyltransferase [Rhodospirillales bacterium]|nr:CCA tRNA nucleotidyltransferase [Rhodospirillales bacterium]
MSGPGGPRSGEPPWMNEAPVQTLLGALTQAGIAARFVGGCVRDWVLGWPISDIDIAVDKPPETVMKALEAADIKVVPTGLKHGTVTAIVKSRLFEITTLRRDVETDGRRAIVAFTDDWRTDAERRDFTFNALYAEPDGTIHDYFDGQADLLAGRVRFIGDPEQRIAEDRLRVLRFFRFHAHYGKPPFDGASFDACRRNAATVSGLSGERVRKELFRTLDASGGADAFDAMLEAGVLDHWLPEYAGSAKLRALAAREEKPDALRRLAAILPADADATAIGKRLKLSTQESVRLQLLLDPANAIDTTNRRASLYRLGTKLFIDRVLLDAPGDWRAALALAGAWTPPELPIGGNDALALGLKPGPKVGALIEAVERWWIAGDFSADRAACLAELKRLADAQA